MKKISVRTLVTGAALTAIVVLLQWLGASIRFGMFSVSLVLIPIVVGAAVGGTELAVWLGAVFGLTVIASGGAADFFAISAPYAVPATIAIVMAKGMLAGFCTALVYKAVAPKSKVVATYLSAVVCPVVNTGVFLLGSVLCFSGELAKWGQATDLSGFVIYLFVGLVGVNFLIELGANIVLSPCIVRLLNIRGKKR